MSIYFMRLGEKNGWVKQCLTQSCLKLGFKQTPQELITSNDWQSVQNFWIGERIKIADGRGKDGCAAPRIASADAREIRTFYEADACDVFITVEPKTSRPRYYFACQPGHRNTTTWDNDGHAMRKTLHGWKQLKNGAFPLADENAPPALKRFANHFQRTISRPLVGADLQKLLLANGFPA